MEIAHDRLMTPAGCSNAARCPARHKSRRGELDSKRRTELTFVCDAGRGEGLIFPRDDIKAVRRRHRATSRTAASGKRLSKIVGAPGAFTDPHQRSDHRAHLMM